MRLMTAAKLLLIPALFSIANPAKGQTSGKIVGSGTIPWFNGPQGPVNASDHYAPCSIVKTPVTVIAPKVNVLADTATVKAKTYITVLKEAISQLDQPAKTLNFQEKNAVMTGAFDACFSLALKPLQADSTLPSKVFQVLQLRNMRLSELEASSKDTAMFELNENFLYLLLNKLDPQKRYARKGNFWGWIVTGHRG